MISKKLLPFLLACLVLSFVSGIQPTQAKQGSVTLEAELGSGTVGREESDWDLAWNSTDGNIMSGSADEAFVVGQLDSDWRFPPKFYGVYRGFLFFNTSLLERNTHVKSASLKLWMDWDADSDNSNLIVQAGSEGHPSLPLDLSDYHKDFYSGNAGQLSHSAYTQGAYNNITLNSLGLSLINKDGITKLALRADRDVQGIKVGSGYSYLYSWSEELWFSTSNSSHPPLLDITYTGKPLDLLPDSVSLGIPTFFVIVGLVVILMEKKP